MADLSARARDYLAAFAETLVAPPSDSSVGSARPRVAAAKLSPYWIAVPLAAAILFSVITPIVVQTIDQDTHAVASASTRIGATVRRTTTRVRAAVAPDAIAPAKAIRPTPGEPLAPAIVVVPAEPPSRARPRRSMPKPVVRAPPMDAALAREIAILDDARAALQQGDLARARTRLDDHAREFPKGVLAPERGRLEDRLSAARSAEEP